MTAPVQAPASLPPDPRPDPTSDSRFTWGLIIDVFDLLERYGYRRGDDQQTGQAIGLLTRLVGVFEGKLEPDGSASLTAADRSAVIAALDLAAADQRDRASECPDCDFDPDSALCPICERRLARAVAYAAVAAKLTAGDTP